MTRVEEVRRARRLTKAELARRAGMLPQTLHRIEARLTKSLSLDARRKLAPVLQVREDQLLAPYGSPIPPLEDPARPGAADPMPAMILEELRQIRFTLQMISEKLGNKPD